MNKEQIIDEAYEKYLVKTTNRIEDPNDLNWELSKPKDPKITQFTKEEFINKIKTNNGFAERWGLKIEERELSLEERSIIAGSNHNEVSQNIKMFTGIDEDHTLHKNLDDNIIPTKLITITYNNEIIESYE